MTTYPGQTLTRTTLCPITAGCDTSWNRTRVCSEASSTDIKCLRSLCHSGALVSVLSGPRRKDVRETVLEHETDWREILDLCEWTRRNMSERERVQWLWSDLPTRVFISGLQQVNRELPVASSPHMRSSPNNSESTCYFHMFHCKQSLRKLTNTSSSQL